MEMMPPDDELFRRVDEVAHYIWDPIGISESPAARDEYRAYLTAIFGRVKAGHRDKIIEYMKWVVTERMEMLFDRERAEKAADAMLNWKRHIEER